MFYQLQCCRCSRILVQPLYAVQISSLCRYKSTKSHYEVLGVPRTASQRQIKAAFIKLSKKVHPDQNRNDNSHEKFLEVNEAYTVLSKTSSRHEYDMKMKYSNSDFYGTNTTDSGEYGNTNSHNYNDPRATPYWKQDPFSEHGYEYYQRKRNEDWRKGTFERVRRAQENYQSDPEHHPFSIWLRVPIAFFYISFFFLMVKSYKNRPERFHGRALRQSEHDKLLEARILKRKTAEAARMQNSEEARMENLEDPMIENKKNSEEARMENSVDNEFDADKHRFKGIN